MLLPMKKITILYVDKNGEQKNNSGLTASKGYLVRGCLSNERIRNILK